MKIINPSQLVPMDIFEGLEIDLAYAHSGNLLFGEAICRSGARLWLHLDLARVVLLAARRLRDQNLTLVVYDGLRTLEAQGRMLETQRVKDNPHWLREPNRLLSPPGAGGHPRAMAVDVALKDASGALLDMGTPFDYLAENGDAAHNPAHREFKGHSRQVMESRRLLDNAMLGAAANLGIPLIGLPAEWWDFRFPADIYNEYEPLSDAALPPAMRMTDAPANSGLPDFPPEHFEELKARLYEEIVSA